jgi:hypothetical protein
MNILRISMAAATNIMRALLITDFINSDMRGWIRIALVVLNVATVFLPKLKHPPIVTAHVGGLAKANPVTTSAPRQKYRVDYAFR